MQNARGMRLLNIDGRAVLQRPGGYLDVAAASAGRFGPDPQQLFDDWGELLAWSVDADEQQARPEADFSGPLRAPVPRPPQVFAVGLNYHSHATETGMPSTGARPLTFTKFPSCIADPSADLTLSGPRVDWEAELVAVIGRHTHRVPTTEAWAHIAGLTVGQDFSDRDVQLDGTPPQFALGKSFPGFGPLGPALVTPDDFADPDDLEVHCTVNGETVQRARTSQMIHTVPRLIAALSEVCQLWPGDVVFTGTPDGVGMGRTPPRYLRAGDIVLTTIDGIGTLRQRCVAGPAPKEEDRA